MAPLRGSQSQDPLGMQCLCPLSCGVLRVARAVAQVRGGGSLRVSQACSPRVGAGICLSRGAWHGLVRDFEQGWMRRGRRRKHSWVLGPFQTEHSWC